MKYFFNSDSLWSSLFHVLKSVIVLYLNWIILSNLNVQNYVLWSVTSSLLIVATASDFGIGQYTVTKLIHANENDWARILIESLLAIVPLSIVAFLFVFLSMTGGWEFKLIMASLLVLRILTIPFGAFLNAKNKFKVRKILEFVSYVLGTIVISILLYFKGSVYQLLIALNFCFFVGAIITVHISCKSVHNWVSLSKINIVNSIKETFKGSFPFLANNITGLITYGGFVWISSFFLPETSIGQLSVMHTFLFVSAYQMYDVFLKSRQADLIHSETIFQIKKATKWIMIFSPIFIIVLGQPILSIIAPQFKFSSADLALYSIFISCELGYLAFQSLIQVNKKLSHYLIRYSLIRLLTFVLSNISFYFFSNKTDIFTYILFILTGLIVSLIYYMYHSMAFSKKQLRGVL
ncbi:MAG: hypothetical protein HQ490_04575 [Lutibacter sp.]|nr:hypothetical protein [Lutibacter sp.]